MEVKRVKRAGHATRQWIQAKANTSREGDYYRESLDPAATRPRRSDAQIYIYTRFAANVTKAYRYYYNRMVNVFSRPRWSRMVLGACVWAAAWLDGVV